MITAFDADALIYAAADDHPLGAKVRALFDADGDAVGVGSVLLLPEILAKPMRAGADSPEVDRLLGFLARLDLAPLDQHTAALAVSLTVKYGLKPIDSAHLATAVAIRADRFVTNNRKDFPTNIREIQVVYPDQL